MRVSWPSSSPTPSLPSSRPSAAAPSPSRKKNARNLTYCTIFIPPSHFLINAHLHMMTTHNHATRHQHSLLSLHTDSPYARAHIIRSYLTNMTCTLFWCCSSLTASTAPTAHLYICVYVLIIPNAIVNSQSCRMVRNCNLTLEAVFWKERVPAINMFL